ncbi:XRE family transcriptional regulator [Pelagibacterium sp.]|uniref:XRE family transcriptional regulator n=1 Tax=Pelagibacterium sp. TaxID=1967288 RepID=UPI003A915C99
MSEAVWKKRLRSAIDERGMTMKQASLAAGQGETFVRDILERNRAPSIDKFVALAKALGVRPERLLAEADPKDDGPRDYQYVTLDEETGQEIDPDAQGFTRDYWRPKVPGAIPELDVEAGAGEGTVGNIIVLPMGGGTVSAHEVVDEWPLPDSWLREVVNNPGDTIIVPIRGDSMVPNYMPSDRVVVDMSQDTLQVDGVYLISYDMQPPQIKRLQRIPLTLPPKVAIKSDNPAYDTHEVEVDRIRIHGRVCAYVGRR